MRRRAESLGLQGRIMITAHRTFVSGCEGPSIAVLRTQVVYVKPNNLIFIIMHWQN